MKTSRWWVLATFSILLLAPACGDPPSPSTDASLERDNLVGAWRSKIRFNSGALAEIKDLEFLYAFNLGGTMTESSNYDGAPPGYGVLTENVTLSEDGQSYASTIAYILFAQSGKSMDGGGTATGTAARMTF